MNRIFYCLKKNTMIRGVAFLFVTLFIINSMKAQYITASDPDSALLNLEQRLISSQSKLNGLIDSLTFIVLNSKQTISNRRAAIDLLLATEHDRAYDFLLENIDIDLGGPVHVEDMDEPFAGFECFNALLYNGNSWQLLDRVIILYTKEIPISVIELSSFLIKRIIPSLRGRYLVLQCMDASVEEMNLNKSEKTHFDQNFQKLEHLIGSRK